MQKTSLEESLEGVRIEELKTWFEEHSKTLTFQQPADFRERKPARDYFKKKKKELSKALFTFGFGGVGLLDKERKALVSIWFHIHIFFLQLLLLKEWKDV